MAILPGPLSYEAPVEKPKRVLIGLLIGLLLALIALALSLAPNTPF
jgi:hypothetical protein